MPHHVLSLKEFSKQHVTRMKSRCLDLMSSVRASIFPGVGFGVCYPQGVVVVELASLFVIVSNNPEDIWVLRIPLASLAASGALPDAD